MLTLVALACLHAFPASGDEPLLSGVRAVDLEGQVHHLGFDGRARAVALVFLGSECPVSLRYAPRLNELAREAAARDVEFYGVVSEDTLAPSAARAFQRERELAFPVLFDAAGDLAERLAPERMPEAFVLDADGRLVYRGRIDDRFVEPGKLRPRIDRHDLLDALEAVARGEPVREARTAAVGCVFESWSGPRTVTWARDIAPILAANCVECHRPGDVAPFALLAHADAQKHARMMAEVCSSGFMPPWKAAPQHGSFREERRLGARQLAALRAWSEIGRAHV